MLIAVAIAVLVAFDVPLMAVAVVAVAVAHPLWAGCALALFAIVRLARRPPERPIDLEARFLLALAAELRSGATWRRGLSAAADRVPALALGPAVARAKAGRSAGRVGEALREGLPHLGRPAAAALRLVADAGAPAAMVFGALADQAAQRSSDQREQAAATAQARLSAGLVGGAPIMVAFVLLASGRAEAAVGAGPAGWALLAVGAALLAAGGATVAAMLRAAQS